MSANIPAETKQFVGLVCGTDTPVFQTCLDDKNKADKGTFRSGKLETLWPWLQEQQAAGHGVFLTVNETKNGRKEEHVTKVRALYVEFDKGQQPPETWHLPPSLVVQSKNGLHVYWLLNPGATVAQCREGLARLIARYGSDPKIKDASRVLRLPGTLHVKADKGQQPVPFAVKLLRADGHRYDYAQAVETLPAIQAQPKPERRVAPAVQGGELAQALADIASWEPPVAKEAGGAGRDKFKTCCRLVNDYDLTAAELWTAARAWADRCVPPLDDDELDKAMDHAQRYNRGFESPEAAERRRDKAVAEDWGLPPPAKKAVHIPEPDLGDGPLPAGQPQDKPKRGRPSTKGLLNDTLVATKVADMHAEDLKYVHEQGWILWDGTHWQDAKKEQHVQVISDMLQREAATAQTGKAEWLNYLNTRNIEAVAKRMRALPNVALVVDDLNKQDRLFVHKAGTVNLDTGELLPHRREDLSTRCAPCAPTSSYAKTKWQTFLDRVLPDKDTQAFVQRAIGSSLWGFQKENAWFMCTGVGRNGKGTFVEAVQAALGDYAIMLTSEFLMESNSDKHPTEVMDLFGVRVAFTDELPRKNIDEAKLKRLTGGGRIRARRMGKDFQEFEMSHTLWLLCNAKPRVKEGGIGFWRRAHVIPFDVNISAQEDDKELKPYLKSHPEVVLAWILEGARMYREAGYQLAPSKEVERATAEYRQDQDFFGTMLSEICEIGEDYTVRKPEFRAAVDLYYAVAGMGYTLNDPRIKEELRAHGINKDKQTNTKAESFRSWVGLQLKPLVINQLRQEAQKAGIQIPQARAA